MSHLALDSFDIFQVQLKIFLSQIVPSITICSSIATDSLFQTHPGNHRLLTIWFSRCQPLAV